MLSESSYIIWRNNVVQSLGKVMIKIDNFLIKYRLVFVMFSIIYLIKWDA